MMKDIERYMELLFADSSFGMLLGIISIWYSFYLFKRPAKVNRLLFITMSNNENNNPRYTTIFIFNAGNCDVIKEDVLESHPITFSGNEFLSLGGITKKYSSFPEGRWEFRKTSENQYLFEFDILKQGNGYLFSIEHDSKRHMDIVWKDINLSGVIKNFEVIRDDFSDQMVYRANNVYLEAFAGVFFVSTVIAYGIKTLLKPFAFDVPFIYLFVGVFIASAFPIYNFVAGKVGYGEYKLFWKFMKRAE